MALFSGKKGLVLGVANDYSIAWAISQKLLAEGAEIGFTHLPGEKMERRVRKLTDLIGVCKAALDAAVKYLAYDLGPKKIRVNAVSAGPVKTLAASAVGDFDKLAGLYDVVSPLGRNIEREEVGSAGMFLLSDLASGI